MAFWIDTGTGVSENPGTTAVRSAIRQYATEGGEGMPPTIPGAEWFNMMTDEVLAVLAEAGIAPDRHRTPNFGTPSSRLLPTRPPPRLR